MRALTEILFIAHTASGFLALVSAVVAAAVKMLDAAHRWHAGSGRVFFAAMLAVFFTAVPLAVVAANVFLLLVAVFSAYLAWSGWSYARNRAGAPRPSDWLRAGGMLAAAAVMAVHGARLLRADDDNGITLLVFAAIGAALSGRELGALRAGGVAGRERIKRHLTMMLAGLIATVTAFVVVNFSFQPAVVLWLAPTALITPLIVIYNRRIARGLTPRGMPIHSPREEPQARLTRGHSTEA